MGSSVPATFEAYVRVFHPVQGSTPAKIHTWREVCHHNVKFAHSLMQWQSIRTDRFGGVWPDGDPEVGSLPLHTFRGLVRSLLVQGSQNDCSAGWWRGWAILRDLLPRLSREGAFRPSGATASTTGDTDVFGTSASYLDLPQRSYTVLQSSLGGLLQQRLLSVSALWRSPNILWSSDRSWFLATEIDFDSTLLGGSRALIDKVAADASLELMEVHPSDNLTVFGDIPNAIT